MLPHIHTHSYSRRLVFGSRSLIEIFVTKTFKMLKQMFETHLPNVIDREAEGDRVSVYSDAIAKNKSDYHMQN